MIFRNNINQTNQTKSDELYTAVYTALINNITTFTNDVKTIDGEKFVNKFYYEYLFKNPSCDRKHRKQLRRAIYSFILQNNLIVIGGRFNQNHLFIRLFIINP